MIYAQCSLSSLSPYGQGKAVMTKREQNESHEEFEERCWIQKAHVENGEMVIPPMAFANSIKDAARYSGLKIQGKRNATWTKHFVSGVMVVEPLSTGVASNDIGHEWLFIPSDGKPGSGSRVNRCFPVIPRWHGVVTYLVIDPEITKDVFATMLEISGNLIGIGRFRPQNRGYYGRFEVESIDWTEAK